jgi:hypothetical protein
MDYGGDQYHDRAQVIGDQTEAEGCRPASYPQNRYFMFQHSDQKQYGQGHMHHGPCQGNSMGTALVVPH